VATHVEPRHELHHRHPRAIDAVPRNPAMDMAPPASPNMVRAPEAKGIRENFVETLIFKGLASPLALVLVVLQSRYLHTSGRGSYVLVILSVTILTRLLGQLGYAVTNRAQKQDAQLRPLVQASFAIGIVLGLLGTGAIIAWGAASADIGLKVSAIAAAALIPQVVWQGVCGVLLGLNRVRMWNVIQTLPPVLSLVGVLVLVVGLKEGVTGAVLAWTLSHFLTALFALVATRFVWVPMPWRKMLDLFNLPLAELALTMGAVQVVNLIAYRAELLVLNHYRNVNEVGVYSISVQTAEMMWLIAGSLATAMTAPCLHESEDEAAKLVRKSAAKTLVYTTVVAVVVGAFVPYAFGPLLGSSFDGASTPLRLLLPGVTIYAPVTIFVVYLSVRHGRPHLSLAVSVLGLVGTVIAALILIPRYGASGAALSSTIGYAVGAALAWVFFERLRREKTAAVPATPVPAAASPS
jgi:O-antigen/teichoic acid export membrane protein